MRGLDSKSNYIVRLAAAWLGAGCISEAEPARQPAILPVLQSVRLDGVVTQPGRKHEVTVPNGTNEVQMTFGVEQTSANAVRVRYRLEGFDSEWLDPPAQMRAALHFLDAQGLEVGASILPISGSSRDWNGSMENSVFTGQEMEAVAPSRAQRIYIEFVSGGLETTLGTYLFRDVALEVLGTQGPAQRRAFPANTGRDLGDPLGAPSDWLRQGSKPEMSELIARPDASADNILALRDFDSRSYCTWRLAPASHIPVQAGDRVRATWKNSFSLGAAGPATAKYRFLRPKTYRFQMRAVSASGEPLGEIVEVPVLVRPPLWQQPWTWLLGGLAVLGAVALMVRRVTQRRIAQQLAALERQRALEGERARIARDIHDELGAGLAQIVMLSELAQTDAAENAANEGHLQEIFSRAHAAGRKLDEIVWAINPDHDSAEDLVGYLARFAQDYLRLAKIRFRLDVSLTLPEIGLTSGQRHQVFLAAKEAIHNAVKHGSPTEICVKVRVECGRLLITITDDGCGFVDTEQTGGGRGSASMRSRLENLGGGFHRQASPGAGTSITLTLPLNAIVL